MRIGQFARSEIWTISYWGAGQAAMVRPVNKENPAVVPIFLCEGESGLYSMRPASSDLLLSVLSICNARLESVEMYEGKDGGCLCRLIINQDNRRRILDTRPGEALPLMMKCGCDLFVSREVFSHRGIPMEQVALLTEARLKRELSGALAAENYELAALIRDQLEQIK